VFARLHVLESTPEQSERGLEIVRDQLLPWLQESTGFRGLLRLSNREGTETLVITLWGDEEALQASAEAGSRLSELTAETLGVTRRALKEYEVTIFDVDA
jgi:heme-degrading monooxygenase HmoA